MPVLIQKLDHVAIAIGTHIFRQASNHAPSTPELIALELAAKALGPVPRGRSIGCSAPRLSPRNDRYSSEVRHPPVPMEFLVIVATPELGSTQKKSKSGCLLAINLVSLSSIGADPSLRQIRFGRLDLEDWIGQIAQTGQQARLTSDALNNTLMQLHRS